MKLFLILVVLAWSRLREPPWVGVVITNAPGSLGNCMPEKPSGGCP